MAKVKTDVTKEYLAMHDIKHNGDSYRIGESIALTELEAVQLFAIGAIVEKPDNKNTGDTGDGDTGDKE